jgi:hypothetical protein
MRLDDALPQTAALKPFEPTPWLTDNVAEPSSSGFKQALDEVQSVRTVQAGDNLVGIVRQQAQSQGIRLTDSQTLRWAQTLAAQNGMPNANRILPGQQLNLAAMQTQWKEFGPNALAMVPAAAGAAPLADKPLPTAAAVLSAKAAIQQASPPAVSPVPNRASNATIPKTAPAGAAVLSTANPVLDKTLDRAVNKGFIPANEKQAVYQKVVQMATKHGFAPDDFARMTLMESDGMNPKASNQRCHGIIQFCDGPARGAAAVGMASNPKSILGLSVYQQLHLADTYFQKAGLNKQQGAVPLDDLYLSVLQPAARSETRANAPLGIMGTQAGALYGDKDTNPTITRQSIVRGLMQNAQRVLGMDRAQAKQPDNRAQNPLSTPSTTPSSNPASAPASPAVSAVSGNALSSHRMQAQRVQAQRVASYEAPDAASSVQQ